MTAGARVVTISGRLWVVPPAGPAFDLSTKPHLTTALQTLDSLGGSTRSIGRLAARPTTRRQAYSVTHRLQQLGWVSVGPRAAKGQPRRVSITEAGKAALLASNG